MSLILLLTFVSIMVTSSNTFDRLVLRKCPFKDLTNITIHMPHEHDCRKFYKCYNGERVLFRCPMNTYFNTYRCVCDRNQKLNCNLLSSIISRGISNKLRAESTNVSTSVTGTISTSIILNSSTVNPKTTQITKDDLTTNPTVKSTSYNEEPIKTISMVTTKNEDEHISTSILQSSIQSKNNFTADINSLTNTNLSNDSTMKSNMLFSESILQTNSYLTKDLSPETSTIINIVETTTSKESATTTTTTDKTATLTTLLSLTNSKSMSTVSQLSSTSYAEANLTTNIPITRAETSASNSVTNITIPPTKESITSVISNQTLAFTCETTKSLNPTMESEDFDYILKLSENNNENEDSKSHKKL